MESIRKTKWKIKIKKDYHNHSECVWIATSEDDDYSMRSETSLSKQATKIDWEEYAEINRIKLWVYV